MQSIKFVVAALLAAFTVLGFAPFTQSASADITLPTGFTMPGDEFQDQVVEVYFYQSTSSTQVADFEAMTEAFIANGFSPDGLPFLTEVPFSAITGNSFVDALLVVDGSFTNDPLSLAQLNTTLSNIEFEITSTSSLVYPGGVSGSFAGVTYGNDLVFALDANGDEIEEGSGDDFFYEALFATPTGFGNFSAALGSETPFDINLYMKVDQADGSSFGEGNFSLSVHHIPEPASLALVFVGGCLILSRRWH